jgi:predicted nuclease with TOPRIM domain
VKCEGITAELETSQKESRQYSAEVFRLKSQYQESQDSIEGVRHENKALAEEIRDLCEQLSSGGKSAHELEKV